MLCIIKNNSPTASDKTHSPLNLTIPMKLIPIYVYILSGVANSRLLPYQRRHFGESRGITAVHFAKCHAVSVNSTFSHDCCYGGLLGAHSFSNLLFWIRESTQNRIFQVARKSFDNCNNGIFTKTPLKAQTPSVYHIYFCKYSSLHHGPILLINGVVAHLVEEKGCGIDQNRSIGDTSLAWAARNGHEIVVKTLLGRADINPDKLGEDGQTPLFQAARNEHEGIAKMLLGRDDVNPDGLDNWGQTPLGRAAEYGHVGVVETLLRRDDVNPD